MDTTPESYKLSFVSGWQSARILFSVETGRLDLIRSRLSTIVSGMEGRSARYCEERAPTFSIPLDGSGNFGYGSCGTLRVIEDCTSFEIELGPGKRLRHCALTVHCLAAALYPRTLAAFKDGCEQQVCFTTLCERSRGYGHAVSGYIFPTMMQWLRELGKDNTRVIREVVDAMQAAWCAVSRKSFRKYADECHGIIRDDGRFTLICFGNACDLSIYDETFHGSVVEFSCHNLDTVEQQMTLLAGFAKMCELAR